MRGKKRKNACTQQQSISFQREREARLRDDAQTQKTTSIDNVQKVCIFFVDYYLRRHERHRDDLQHFLIRQREEEQREEEQLGLKRDNLCEMKWCVIVIVIMCVCVCVLSEISLARCRSLNDEGSSSISILHLPMRSYTKPAEMGNEVQRMTGTIRSILIYLKGVRL
jgi:hypothetical protein